MEEIQPKTGKFSWTYGLLGGSVIIIFSFMLYMMDVKEQGFGTQAIGILILAISIILAIISFKKQNEGYLKIGQAVKIGAGIGLVVALLTIIYILLLTYFIDPEYMASIMEMAKQKALESNPQMTDEQWEVGMSIQKYVQYPAIIIMNIIIGLIIGAITGAIVKNPRPE